MFFYIEQDDALKLPENDNYVIDFDPNEVKAGDVLFISHTIKEKAYIILIKDEKFAKFVKTVRELRSKQEEERKKYLHVKIAAIAVIIVNNVFVKFLVRIEL